MVYLQGDYFMKNHYSNLKVIIVLFLIALLTLNCSKKEEAELPQKYQASGVIVSVDRENNYVTIDHGDIPGFMSAMIMPFSVVDSTLLEGLGKGDKVNFTVEATESMFFVSEIKQIEK